MWAGNRNTGMDMVSSNYNSPGGYSAPKSAGYTNSFHSRYGSQVTGGMSQYSPKQQMDNWYNNANENNKKMSAFSPAGRPLSRSKGNEYYMQQASMGMDQAPVNASVVTKKNVSFPQRRAEWPGVQPGSNPPVTRGWTPNVMGRPTKWKNCPPEIEANEAAAKLRFRRDKQAAWIRTRRAQPGYVSPRARTGNPRGRPRLPEHLKMKKGMKAAAMKGKTPGKRAPASSNTFSPLALRSGPSTINLSPVRGAKTPSVKSKNSKAPHSPRGW